MKHTLYAGLFVSSLALAATAAPPPSPLDTPTKAPSAAAKTGDPYASADRSLGELNRGVNQLSDCVAAYEYLQASAAKAAKKYTSADGTVPSHMAALIPTKLKMADNKRLACLTQGNALGNRFNEVRSEFADFEPRNAKGLKSRLLELSEMRAKSNGLLGRLGAKPAKPSRGPKANKDSESSESEE